MSFDTALRATEVLLGFALLQASLEHLALPRMPRAVFALRAVFAIGLMAGVGTAICLIGLWGLALVLLHRFQGPYNGGSDKMGLLVLTCLLLAHLTPNLAWRELAFAYLATQLTLSYFISGGIKIINTEWRRGRALADVFAFSAYPVSTGLRDLARRPRLLLAGSWAVMGFEVLFPLALLNTYALWAACGLAALFHLSNACFFGLNRFFWIWLAAWPSLLWLQMRLVPG